jgi:hypothetical protein
LKFGGLGLFPIKEFLQSQKLRWIILAEKCIDSEWKEVLSRLAIGNMFRFDTKRIGETGPILAGFVTMLACFKKKYADLGNNYKKLRLFGEDTLPVSVRSTEPLGIRDLDMIQNNQVREQLLNAKVSDLWRNGIPATRLQLEAEWGGIIPVHLYNKIIRVCTTAHTKFNKNIELHGISIDTFFSTWKRGSKKFRRILLEEVKNYVSHNIFKFAANMETVLDSECSVFLNGVWNFSYYSNQLRTFLYKLHNNILPTNTILSHFVRGRSRNCTLCNLIRNPDPEDETPYHLFYDCQVTERLRLNFYQWLNNDNAFIQDRHSFFCCGSGSLVVTAVNNVFKFYIWEMKQRDALPDLTGLKKFVLKEINVMTKVSKKFELLVENSTLTLNLQRLG